MSATRGRPSLLFHFSGTFQNAYNLLRHLNLRRGLIATLVTLLLLPDEPCLCQREFLRDDDRDLQVLVVVIVTQRHRRLLLLFLFNDFALLFFLFFEIML